MVRAWWAVLLGGLVLLASPGSASAQVSLWLKDGVSGAGAATFVQGSEDQTAFGVNGGYSMRGRLDLGLSIAYLTFPDDGGLPADLISVAVAPRVEWHPVKQSRAIPVSIGLGGGVTVFGFSSDELDRRGAELDSYSVSADASVYRFFKLSSNVGITPAAALGYVHSSTTLTTLSNETTETEDSASLALGGYVAFLDQGGRIWGVAPSVTFGTEVTVLGLQAGLVWTL